MKTNEFQVKLAEREFREQTGVVVWLTWLVLEMLITSEKSGRESLRKGK